METQTYANRETVLPIRGMVCPRCIEAIHREFERLSLPVTEVRLGQARVRGVVSPDQMNLIEIALEKQGFSLLRDVKAALLQRVKTVIEQTLDREDLGDRKFRFSDILSAAFQTKYDTLSGLFSAHEGKSLEKYIIEKRLDKVKELLVYTGLPLADIAYRIGFSSVPHLSNQFKRLTGLSPTYFRTVRREKQGLQQQKA